MNQLPLGGAESGALAALERLAPEMGERRERADEGLRRLGGTFPLPGDDAEGDRVLPAD